MIKEDALEDMIVKVTWSQKSRADVNVTEVLKQGIDVNIVRTH